MKESKEALEIFDLFTSMKQVFGCIREAHAKNSSSDLESLILLFINFNEDVSQSMIVNTMKIPKQTVNNIIVNLNKEGYLEYLSNEKDKRQKILSLTERGRKYAKKLLEPMMTFNENLYKKLGKEKVQTLIKYNKDLSKEIENLIKED